LGEALLRKFRLAAWDWSQLWELVVGEGPRRPGLWPGGD